MSAVVLGVGNPLYGDDGFGIAALSLFEQRFRCGDDVELIDGGTQGIALLGVIEDATELVILDVVQGESLTPGAFVEYDAARLASGVPLKLSEHQVGVEEVLGLAVWRERLPARSVLLGVVAGAHDFGASLSDEVAAALPVVVDRAAQMLRDWGREVVQRS